MKRGTRATVDVSVAAAPAMLYETVSDVRRMGDWSPECTRCEWIGSATGPVVGARFKGTNRHGLMRWSTKPRVVVANAPHEFAFVTAHLGRDMTKWSYEFRPTADDTGTVVTESFEMLRDMPWYFRAADRWLMGIRDRERDLVTNMGQTLARIKAVVEAGNAADR
jgi:Polyketide cyclase / dehydrase and lipid transport